MRTPLSSRSCAAFRVAPAVSRGAQALGLAGLILVAGCQSSAWNDAWAQCEANAIEQGEFADVDRGQRTTWRERYIGACMQSRGFYDPQYLYK